MDFTERWMLTLAGGAFFGLCAVAIDLIRWMHGRHQKSHSARAVRP
jgi:hypothetical protein